MSEENILDRPITRLELSARAYKCCREMAGIQSIGQLVEMSDRELLRIKNFGHKSLTEVKEKLASLGLSLGMTNAIALEDERRERVSIEEHERLIQAELEEKEQLKARVSELERKMEIIFSEKGKP